MNPSARGRGASDLLLSTTIDWARVHDYPELRLWVIDGNYPAESLYRRKGFRATGRKHPCSEDDPRLESEMVIACGSK